MNTRVFLGATLLSLALAACSNSSDSAAPITPGEAGGAAGAGAGGAAGSEAGGAGDGGTGGGLLGSFAQDELDTFKEGGDTSNSAQLALLAADNLFNFDPTIDTAKTAAENAQAVADRAKETAGGCGAVTVSGTTVTAAYGPSPGCTLATGLVVSGTVTATVTAQSGMVTVALSFQDFTVEGTTLTGTASLATSNGSTFQVTLALASSSGAVSGTVQVVGAAGAFTVDGPLTKQKDSSTSQTAFTALHYTVGSCYPDGGSVSVTKGKTKVTYQFSSTTPTTGQVTATVGKTSSTVTLPAYGSCPGTGSYGHGSK